MRTILIGVFGCVLLVVGSIAGVGGLGLLVTDPCTPTYRLSLQPADAASATPERTVSYGELRGVQKVAVDAALENRSKASFRTREPLAELTDVVIKKGGDRYVAHLRAAECRTPYDELAIAGFTGAVLGVLVIGFALVVHRHSR